MIIRWSLGAAIVASLVALAGRPVNAAADWPEWAYPVNPPVSAFDATVAKQLPGSAKQFTQAQIEDDFNPPDWYPEDHPSMPPVVANGRPPAVKACSKCHISSGAGHPESADIAGLPVGYVERQMAERTATAKARVPPRCCRSPKR